MVLSFISEIGKAFFTIIASAIKTSGVVLSYFLDAMLSFLRFLGSASLIEKVVGVVLFFVVTIIILKFIVQSVKSLIWFLLLLGVLVLIALIL